MTKHEAASEEFDDPLDLGKVSSEVMRRSVFPFLPMEETPDLDGVVFFWMYAPPGTSSIVYSAIYNGSYMLPELVISGILIYILIQRDILNLNI